MSHVEIQSPVAKIKRSLLGKAANISPEDFVEKSEFIALVDGKLRNSRNTSQSMQEEF